MRVGEQRRTSGRPGGAPPSGARLARRFAAIGAAIALGLLLLGASEARGARYTVAQCGWGVGADADWEAEAASGSFRPGSECAAPQGKHPLDSVHLSSVTSPPGGSVAGARFARWRWVAPPGTAIVGVRGNWWGALHDGFEHRLGSGGGGDFSAFASAEGTEQPRTFAAGFGEGRRTFESRLLCAKPRRRRCDLRPSSSASVRSLELTIADRAAPRPRLSGGIAASAWRRGAQDARVEATDAGSGVRLALTLIDGARTAFTRHPCAEGTIGGARIATRMRPCELSRGADEPIATQRLSDGRHSLRACAVDFAGNRACTPPRSLRTDNTAPAAPRALALRGAAGWRRENDFDLVWADPDQGRGSPIAGAAYRLRGALGFDSGVRRRVGAGIDSLHQLRVPASGAYLLSVWLRDRAGNESQSNAETVPLLFDDVAPSVSFRADRDRRHPEMIRALAGDSLSGPAKGGISYRRAGRRRWRRIPTTLRRSPGSAGNAELIARFPSDRLRPGRYRLRAVVFDLAGNRTATTRRSDGSAMVLRAPLMRRTALRVRLRLGNRAGRRLTVPYGGHAILSGRLHHLAKGLAGRRVRVAIRPVRGSLARPRIRRPRTGTGGRFRLALDPGPSRLIRVTFPGTETLARVRPVRLRLGVRSGVTLAVSPTTLEVGEALALRGRVRSRGASLPSRGKLVVIEYLERASRRWQPVLVCRARRAGRFRSRYRFRYVSSLARIRLRAMVPPEQGWPYATGASAPVTVTVRG